MQPVLGALRGGIRHMIYSNICLRCGRESLVGVILRHQLNTFPKDSYRNELEDSYCVWCSWGFIVRNCTLGSVNGVRAVRKSMMRE